MKAVTVAGGSSDDPKIEAETTVVEGEPETTAEARPEAGAGADAGAVGADAAGADRAEPDAADAVADTEPRAEDAADAVLRVERGEDDSETDAEPEAQTVPRAAADPAAEAEPHLAGRPEKDAGPDAEADAEADAEPTPDVETLPQAEAEAEADAAARPEKDAGPEGEAVPQAVSAPESEPEPAGEANAEPEGEDARQAAPKTRTDARPVTEAQGAARSEVADEPEAATQGEDEDEDELPGAASSEADTDPRSKTDGDDGDGDGPAAPDQVGTASEPQAPGGDTPGSDAETADEAPSDRTMLITRPKATSAEDTPDTEPDVEAPSDRTMLITRPKPKPTPPDTPAEDEPDIEADVEAPSDETMLIARPKEKSTEPDAPRKAPSWARKAEPAADADPERTSQFVALKDVDLPAPVAPRATPRPSEARVVAPAPAAPLPPLDLLADLTNTPPPAETPRRTAVRRVKIWTPILLLLVGAGVGAQLLRPLPTPQLVASKTDGAIDGQFSIPWPAEGQGAVRVSGSGDLGTFGEEKPVPTASVAKVMTAYVILKGHPLRKSDPGPDITVDAKAVADGSSEHESRIRSLTVGQKFSQQDMLKMLMIPSGNNIGRLLARWDSGTDSEAAFVAKMNAAAKELGMDNTTYTDPSGLDSATVSTAADQLKLAEAVMKDEVFRTIVALPNATIKGLPERLENNNILLNSQGLSIRGIKTGSSTPAGGTLMWAAYKSIGDETPLILGTLMDQHADGPDLDGGDSLKLVLANSKKIIEAVRNALAAAPVIRKGDVVGHLDDGLGGRTQLVATKDLNVIGVPGQQLKLSLTAPAGAGPLPHTAKAGTEVAVLTVGDGESAKKVPVAVKGALAEPSFGTRLTRGR
ncbi:MULTISPECIES: D-alanyl-D-alanine carboxypeptidase [unclassified Streptomyces]|uniref:D-alanyl-D-alanine carboxypeptidase n=1 Tax=unclassified Streptomyces TaxID=2593676 RepID=UPI001F203A11|nr:MULTISPECIES: serine hydrolase [unclassified Streptomyces]